MCVHATDEQPSAASSTSSASGGGMAGTGTGTGNGTNKYLHLVRFPPFLLIDLVLKNLMGGTVAEPETPDNRPTDQQHY